MFASPTLLVAHEGKSGPFIRWLEELGLGEFLKRYPLAQLIEWGWIVPQYRVTFPQRFFESWENYPCIPWEPPEDLDQYAILWDYYWSIEDESEPLWFLDPLFHTGDHAGELLRHCAYLEGPTLPPAPIDHARGMPIAPYADYFYHWQGYALVDVIRWADNIEPIYSTPDVVERAHGVVRVAEWISANQPTWPKDILTAPQRWAGLALPMTWLDHFRAFRDAAFSKHDSDFDTKQALYRKGAQSLAQYFAVTPDMLAEAIKGRLLVLAQEWMQANDKLARQSIWTLRAWPHLRADIQLAMSWLILLTGKTFEDYVAEWRLPFMGNWGWAALDDALPYDFVQHQKKFVQLAPIYLKPFNEAGNNRRQFDETTLPVLVRRLHRSNYPFTGFLTAFHELHEHLSYRSFDKHGLDFRTLRPLDHYALLAIHAEGCLRRELDSLGLLDEIDCDKQGLFRYIQKLARVRGISDGVIGSFCSQYKLADLRMDRDDPIGRIQSIQTGLPDTDHQLVQAFLSCLLARNYFAHHDFLDHELMRSEKSAFMLKGILLTVLMLLDSDP